MPILMCRLEWNRTSQHPVRRLTPPSRWLLRYLTLAAQLSLLVRPLWWRPQSCPSLRAVCRMG